MGLVERLIYGKDCTVRRAIGRVSKTLREISRPVNKQYSIVSIKNEKKEMNDAIETAVTQNHTRREATVTGDY